MTRSALLAATAALALAGCSKSSDGIARPDAPVASVPPPAGRQWTDVVAATPDGGYRMGNPEAPVKLVEYGAFSCPHCKAFAAEGVPVLKRDYVASGRVSYELRPFLLHSPDVPVTLLVQCRGPETFFPIAEQVFGAQDTWMGKLIQVPERTQEGWQQLAPVDQYHAIRDASGLKGFLAARGLPGAQQDRCLGDAKGPSRLVGIRDHATNDLGVNGTPTFIINGNLVDNAASWGQLEPRLKDALG